MSAEANRWERLSELYEAAVERPLHERDAFVRAATTDAPGLTAELLEMLHTSTTSAQFELERWLGLESPPPPTLLGPWRVIAPIGSGGMGEVYLADRDDPAFSQRVAIKILRAGLIGSEARARFARERRILARLNHPAVVPFIDGGVAPDGRPYLVMQLVDGEPLTRALDAGRASMAERMRLFVETCRAVQFAHSQLVVHRDLKPSNILVTTDGHLRLLDFGIARMVDDDQSEEGVTKGMPAPMTPERASPEQWRGGPSGTASDVWALGVLLYELATGALPFSREQPAAALGLAIANADAPRPSRVVQIEVPGAASPADRAQARGLTPLALSRQLRGDFDTIVMRALQPAPDRRYGSADALADDVLAWLDGRPVTAQRDSWRYRTGRFIARHRTSVAAAAIATVIVGVLGGGYITQNLRAARERDRATAESAHARETADLLIELFRGASPVEGAGTGDVSIASLLERGNRRVEALTGQPELQGRLWFTLARLHADRSEFDRARSLLERSLGATSHLADTHPDRVGVVIEFASTLVLIHERRDEARTRLLALVTALEGTADAPRGAMAKALEVLALATRGEPGAGYAQRALELRRASIPLDAEGLAGALDTMAKIVWEDLHDQARAREMWRESLALLERLYGADDVRTVTVRANVGTVAETIQERIAINRLVLAAREKMFGPTATSLGSAWTNLGIDLFKSGDLAGAEDALGRAQTIWEARLGRLHRETISNLWNLGRMSELVGRYEESVRVFEDLEARTHEMQMTPADQAMHQPALARSYRLSGRLQDARALLTRALGPLASNVIAAESLADAYVELGRLDLLANRPAAAVTSLRDAVRRRERIGREDHGELHEARAELGRALIAAGQQPEGVALLARELPLYASWSLAQKADVAVLREALARTGTQR